MQEKKHSSESVSLDARTATSPAEATAAYDAATEKRILKKMDIRILPAFSLLYLFSFLGTSSFPFSAGTDLTPFLPRRPNGYRYVPPPSPPKLIFNDDQ